MSHTTKVEGVVFSNVAALRNAVAELNRQGVSCTLLENQRPRAFYQNQSGLEEARYVLRLNSCDYDVGFYWDETKKAYEARTDLWAGKVAAVLGTPLKEGGNAMRAALGKLNQTYAIHAATMQAAKQGYQVRRVNKEDGTVRLVVTGIQ
jgi:hypothetical protein